MGSNINGSTKISGKDIANEITSRVVDKDTLVASIMKQVSEGVEQGVESGINKGMEIVSQKGRRSKARVKWDIFDGTEFEGSIKILKTAEKALKDELNRVNDYLSSGTLSDVQIVDFKNLETDLNNVLNQVKVFKKDIRKQLAVNDLKLDNFSFDFNFIDKLGHSVEQASNKFAYSLNKSLEQSRLTVKKNLLKLDVSVSSNKSAEDIINEVCKDAEKSVDNAIKLMKRQRAKLIGEITDTTNQLSVGFFETESGDVRPMDDQEIQALNGGLQTLIENYQKVTIEIGTVAEYQQSLITANEQSVDSAKKAADEFVETENKKQKAAEKTSQTIEKQKRQLKRRSATASATPELVEDESGQMSLLETMAPEPKKKRGRKANTSKKKKEIEEIKEVQGELEHQITLEEVLQEQQNKPVPSSKKKQIDEENAEIKEQLDLLLQEGEALDDLEEKKEKQDKQAKNRSKIRHNLRDSDTYGDNPSYAYTYQSGLGQTTTEKYRINKKTGDPENDIVVATNYKQIEDAIINQEKKILVLKQQRNKVETTDNDQLVARNSNQQKYLNGLNEELRLAETNAQVMRNEAQKYQKFNAASESNIQFALDEYGAHLDTLDGKALAKELDAIDKEFEKAYVKMNNSVEKYQLELDKVHSAFEKTPEYIDAQNAIAKIGSAGPDTLDAEIEDASNALLKLQQVVTKFKMDAKGRNAFDTISGAFFKLSDSNNVLENLQLDLRSLGYSSDEAKQKVQTLSDTVSKMNAIDFDNSPTAMDEFGGYLKTYFVQLSSMQNEIQTSRKKIRLGEQLPDSPTQNAVAEYKGYLTVVEGLIKATDELRRAETLYHKQKKLGLTTTQEEKEALKNLEDNRNALNAQFLQIARSGRIGDANFGNQLVAGGIVDGFKEFFDLENQLQLAESNLKNNRASNAKWDSNKEKQDQKAILDVYDKKLKIIKELEKESSKLNDLERKGITTENTEEYLAQYDKVVEKTREARAALDDIYKLRQSNRGVISASQFLNATQSYRTAKTGSAESVAKLNDAKYREELRQATKAKAEEEARIKQNNADYQKQIAIIEKLATAKEKLSKANADLARAKEGTEGYQRALERQNIVAQEYNSQLEKSKDALSQIGQMFASNKITVGQNDDAKNLFSQNVRENKTERDTTRDNITDRINQIREEAKAERDEKAALDELKKAYVEYERILSKITAESNGKHSVLLDENLAQAVSKQNQITKMLEDADEKGYDVSKIRSDAGSSLASTISNEGAKLIDSYINKVDQLTDSLMKQNKMTEQGAIALSEYRKNILQLQSNKDLTSSKGMLNFWNQLDTVGSTISGELAKIQHINDFEFAKGLVSDLDATVVKTKEVKNATDVLKQSLTEISDAKANGFNEEDIRKKELAFIKQVDEKYKELKKTKKGFSVVDDTTGRVKNIKDVSKALDAYAKKEFEIKKLIRSEVNENGEVTNVYRTTKGEVIQLTGAMTNLGNALQVNFKNTGNTVGYFRTLKDTLSGLGKYFTRYLTGYSMLTRAVSQFKQGFNVLKEYDDSLITMSYTMDLTEKRLDAIGQSALDTAKKLSSSLTDTIDVYKIYANMKTTPEDIATTAKPTLVLSNLSGVDANTAADQIQAVVQQFEMTAEQSEHIVDVYDKISANIAVDYSKILELILETI